MNPRLKPVLLGVAILAVAWVLAGVGYLIAEKSRVTAEKVTAFVKSKDLSKLSGDARARAIRELEDKLNALSWEERRRARLEREWRTWFDAMTDGEKSAFIDATMPTGFKKMLDAFEKMPDEQRKRTVANAMRRMKEAQEQIATNQTNKGPNKVAGPEISEDLQKKVTQIGISTFYKDSSAQTKAELAPMLEEIQRMMENGAAMHRMR